jgi:hypothetical protein
MKAFYLKYYSLIKAYRDRGLIYNFWPNQTESIAQAWERLKKYLRKNPCHGISKRIILINFYVRLISFHKEFLDNSSGGSFTGRRADDARIKYNKGYKDEDKDITSENSFVYVQIKFTVKCMYAFDV